MDASSSTPHTSSFGSQLAWRYIQILVGTAGQILALLISVRLLGTRLYGAFVVITSATALMTVLDLGLSLAALQAAAVEASTAGIEKLRARNRLLIMQSLYICMAAVGLFVTAILAVILPNITRSVAPVTDMFTTTVLCGAAVVITLGTSAAAGIVLGRRSFRVAATSSILSTVLNLVCVAVLAPHLHLVGLGIGTLLGAAAGRTIQYRWVRRNAVWYRLFPSVPSRADIRHVLGRVVPFLVITVAVQVVSSTDAIVLSALSFTSVVGIYQIGAVIPTQAVGIVLTGFDVVLPNLVAIRDRDVQMNLAAFVGRAFCYISGLGFGLTIVFRVDIIKLVAGRPAALSTAVLTIFATSWTLNVIIHAPILIIIARGRQSLLTWAVLCEAGINLGVTVFLVTTIGPLGAAYGTLVAMAIGAFGILPLLGRGEFNKRLIRLLAGDGVLPALLGAFPAMLVSFALPPFVPSVARLAVGGSCGVALGVGFGVVALGSSGRMQGLNLLRNVRSSTETT